MSLSEEHETSMSVRVRHGDILNNVCDVIYNTTSNNFDLTGQLATKLIAKGGNSIATECQKTPLYSGPTYRVTNGGKLTCKYVIHVATPGKPSGIPDTLLEALTVVDRILKLKTIAVPAIGTGCAGMSSADVAKHMKTAFENFEKSKPANIQHIDVVVFQSTMLKDFESTLYS